MAALKQLIYGHFKELYFMLIWGRYCCYSDHSKSEWVLGLACISQELLLGNVENRAHSSVISTRGLLQSSMLTTRRAGKDRKKGKKQMNRGKERKRKKGSKGREGEKERGRRGGTEGGKFSLEIINLDNSQRNLWSKPHDLDNFSRLPLISLTK